MTPGFRLSGGMGDTLRAGTSRPPLDPEARASAAAASHWKGRQLFLVLRKQNGALSSSWRTQGVRQISTSKLTPCCVLVPAMPLTLKCIKNDNIS